ncbi:hypothetical protein GNI_190960 [Gregarina niphandrodes]|uniref:Peptidase A2 domain-containing protein n=1 Tax=Gregarina niphandrodes TaxID=110365 RepID=A0A023AWD9_GRENI|nr:hypothetical protein GNI_190960 [Gregarina niphandrodes]EZG43061.1 hypothetical protein GNI_190960 [Gregarina niphandrodes]|eukprot:XP_011133666.1 hypothetical protein GNI_190960 [Gregarina niphandrodes]
MEDGELEETTQVAKFAGTLGAARVTKGVMLNEVVVEALLDTGATTSIVSMDLARQSGLEEAGAGAIREGLFTRKQVALFKASLATKDRRMETVLYSGVELKDDELILGVPDMIALGIFDAWRGFVTKTLEVLVAAKDRRHCVEFEADGKPVKHTLKPLRPELREELDKQIDDMLSMSVIQPTQLAIQNKVVGQNMVVAGEDIGVEDIGGDHSRGEDADSEDTGAANYSSNSSEQDILDLALGNIDDKDLLAALEGMNDSDFDDDDNQEVLTRQLVARKKAW